MEAVLANGDADLVSMARPFLADPEIMNKAARGDVASINTCIGCNQACLDHTFKVGEPHQRHMHRMTIDFKQQGKVKKCACVFQTYVRACAPFNSTLFFPVVFF